MSKQIKKTTYSDIAHLSGVSLATISRILTNSTSVKAETKQKVLDAIKKLGYNTADFFKAPKEAVRGLIIFNIPTLDNPFYGKNGRRFFGFIKTYEGCRSYPCKSY